jgi:hypothetical protein
MYVKELDCFCWHFLRFQCLIIEINYMVMFMVLNCFNMCTTQHRGSCRICWYEVWQSQFTYLLTVKVIELVWCSSGTCISLFLVAQLVATEKRGRAGAYYRCTRCNGGWFFGKFWGIDAPDVIIKFMTNFCLSTSLCVWNHQLGIYCMVYWGSFLFVLCSVQSRGSVSQQFPTIIATCFHNQ